MKTPVEVTRVSRFSHVPTEKVPAKTEENGTRTSFLKLDI